MLFKSLFRKSGKLMLFSLCVAVGTTAVMTVSTLANYAISTAQHSLDSMGLRGYAVTSQVIEATDCLQLKLLNNIEYASPVVSVNATSNNTSLNLIGADTTVQGMYSLDISYGSFYTSNDILCCSPVCVISTNLAEHLYSNKNAVGYTLSATVNGISTAFTVCGVYQSDVIINGYVPDIVDERIYMPYTSLNALVQDSVNCIAVVQKQNADADLNTYLSSIFGNAYTVKNIAADRAKIENMMLTVKTVLNIIGSLTLIVSTVSLTIIMLINIKGARGEIGLKKSVGATDLSILIEVMTESAVISTIGYIIGMLFYGVVVIVGNAFGLKLIPDYSTGAILLVAVLISSMLSGIIPGIIAAKSSPAITMRE